MIANCQAGWQTAIMAATRPELAGPILLAGSPLSYWAGVRGKNPMRYLGGLLGGTWATALAGDLGAGTFDGADLVANFEKLNPANTLWDKPYNVYANVDTEAERFLDFETWWGSPVLLNAGEMQWIADNLFVGNKLAAGKLRTRDGLQIDLRNIQSPIVVFASWGDDITPPQQALGWITDLYSDEADIVAQGQTIVYALHKTVGHLGIFVSGKVATKEHEEFVDAMDMLDMLPPGLYEATFEGRPPNSPTRADRGRLPVPARAAHARRHPRARRERPRGRDALRRRAAHLEHQPPALRDLCRAFRSRRVTPEMAAGCASASEPDALRDVLRRNPFMQFVAGMAEQARENRQPVAPDNPLAQVEQAMASGISTSLTAGEERDKLTEKLFLATYGSPLLQALVGLDAEEVASKQAIERELDREVIGRHKLAEIDARSSRKAASPRRSCARSPTSAAEKASTSAFAVMQEVYARCRPRSASLAELKAIMRDQRALVLRNPRPRCDAFPRCCRPTRTSASASSRRSGASSPPQARRRRRRCPSASSKRCSPPAPEPSGQEGSSQDALAAPRPEAERSRAARPANALQQGAPWPPRPILTGHQVADRRHRQRQFDRLRLRQGVPRGRRRPRGDLAQRQGPAARRAARRALDAALIRRSTSRRRASSKRCSTRSRERWGKLDSLVHSIAFAPKEDLQGGLLDCSAEGFARAMDVSCHSFVRMAKLAAPLMTDGGTMFAMSYVGANRVVANYNVMGPVKAALEAALPLPRLRAGPQASASTRSRPAR